MLTREQIAELERSDSADAREMGRRFREQLEIREKLLDETRAARDWDKLAGAG